MYRRDSVNSGGFRPLIDMVSYGLQMQLYEKEDFLVRNMVILAYVPTADDIEHVERSVRSYGIYDQRVMLEAKLARMRLNIDEEEIGNSGQEEDRLQVTPTRRSR